MIGMEPSRGMSPEQWEAFTLTLANVSMGYSSPSLARSLARTYRDSMTPASHAAYHQWRMSFDVSACLGEIRVPMLILAPRRPHYPSVAPEVASSIAGARIFTIDADPVISGRWLPAETDAVEAFLGIAPAEASLVGEDIAADMPRRMTSRELEVLTLVVAERSNREIADYLSLSERTVARHIANMYEKLGVHGRAEITAYAVRHGLV
jgi:DNA-binding CsgD family transcriptional regulator